MNNPTEFSPVLAKIESQGDLGKSTWSEVVFFDPDRHEWKSYEGSNTFSSCRDIVLQWEYVDRIWGTFAPSELEIADPDVDEEAEDEGVPCVWDFRVVRQIKELIDPPVIDKLVNITLCKDANPPLIYVETNFCWESLFVGLEESGFTGGEVPNEHGKYKYLLCHPASEKIADLLLESLMPDSSYHCQQDYSVLSVAEDHRYTLNFAVVERGTAKSHLFPSFHG